MSDAVTGTTTANTTTTTSNAKPSAGVVDAITGKVPQSKAPQEPNKTTAEKAEAKRYKFEKLKFKGKETDFEADEEEVKRVIQRGLGADSAYNEAKQMREDAERKYDEYHKWKKSQDEESKKLITNPIQAAIERGASPQEVRRVAEEYLLQEIQKDEMSEDAKRALALEQENKKLKDDIEKDNKAKKEYELRQAAIEERNKIVPEMIKFMDSVGMARTAANLSAVAKRLKVAAERKNPISIERAVELTHQDNKEFVKSTVGGQAEAINAAFKSGDSDTILKIGREVEDFLGNEVLVALQRYGIVKWKTKTPRMPNQPIDTAKTRAPQEEPRELTMDEVIEERKRRAAEIDRQRQLR